MRLEQIQILLREELGKEMRVLADKMASGRATTYDGYRQMVGQVQGLGQAIEKVDAVFDKFYNDEGE